MRIEEIQTIINAAFETADSIVGAREWTTAEDANAMHDLIVWDMLSKQLPDISVADLLSILK
ncbi:hypothetical protein E2553_28155 [Paraburkholderia dipogonis]|uniref:Uncharacterized protein n=1 Tax=Paraburkholderia dipogonis TaxID=1211383 RepID=A0A4Y8MT50_9BURK|nr:hypothetical protein [Paraburkholderia dipogonis]TFE40599.1 hypothetical protein E2553_28155 [Paraburkholderia dipogonis]